MPCESLLTLSDIRLLCERLNITPTKKLGQNFVHDHGTLRRIVEAADLPPAADVIEIGPGLGSLTLALLEAGHHVTACEIDHTLATQLPDTIARHCPAATREQRFSLIEKDALTLRDVDLERAGLPARPRHLVANLPYNVSVPVILHMLEQFPSIETMLVMVQKEVGERLCAGPGSKIYGIPSVKMAYYGKAHLAGVVKSGVFWPVPRVDSVLVKLDVQRPHVPRTALFSLVDQAFHMRRKTLRANLKDIVVGTVDDLCDAAGVDPMSRAEALVIDDFVQLTKAWQRSRWQRATVSVPGKINLVLRCGQPDERGYHPLFSIFQGVDVMEKITITPGDKGCDIDMVDSDGSPLAIPDELRNLPAEKNLAIRAVRALLDDAGADATCHIHIQKQVPVAGGMAGGSADAAGALLAANEAFALGYKRHELEKIGRKLGADVPQALYGGTIIGYRYGDVMDTPIPSDPYCIWVFALAEKGLSTPEVFAAFDQHATPPSSPSTDVDYQALTSGDATQLARIMENDLEEAAFTLRPELRQVIECAKDAGALQAMLSGSGPTIGCLCATKEQAKAVRHALDANQYVARTVMCRGPVATSEVHL